MRKGSKKAIPGLAVDETERIMSSSASFIDESAGGKQDLNSVSSFLLIQTWYSTRWRINIIDARTDTKFPSYVLQGADGLMDGMVSVELRPRSQDDCYGLQNIEIDK